MRKILIHISIINLLLVFGASAQPVNTLLGDIAVASPNAAAMAQYVETPVSLNTGTSNINIPLYTINEGPLTFPISLSYHASGIRVEEPASWVGLGWNLNAGGAITRTVLGKPDDQQEGYFNVGEELNENLSGEIFEFTNSVDYIYDTEADIYTFNFAGYSGKFIIDSKKDVHFFPKQDLKLIFDLEDEDDDPNNGINMDNGFEGLNQYIMVTPDGTRYYFGKKPGETPPENPLLENYSGIESSRPGFHINSLEKYISTWYLVRVESADGNYAIDLSYNANRFSYLFLPTCYFDYLSVVATCDEIIAEMSGAGCGGLPRPAYGMNLNNMRINGKVVSQITTPTETIDFVSGSDVRSDLDDFEDLGYRAKRLDAILIETGEYCMEWLFDNNDYFQADDFDDQSVSKRLKLNQVQKRSCSQVGGEYIEEPPYVFTYEDSVHLPSRISKAIDHWGYYNGQHQNDNNVDNISPTTITSELYSYVFSHGSSDRETHGEYQLAGMLTKIQYPTGGATFFTYESNTAKEIKDVRIDLIENLVHEGFCPPDSPYPNSVTISLTQEQIDYGFFKLRMDFIGQDPDGDPPYPPCFPALDAYAEIEVLDGGGQSMGNYIFTSENVLLEPDTYREITLPLEFLSSTLEPGTNYTFSLTAYNAIGSFSLWALIPDVPFSVEVGGVRIQEIRTSTTCTPSDEDIIKTYDYSELANPSVSSGRVFRKPIYGYIKESIGEEGGFSAFAYNNSVDQAHTAVPVHYYVRFMDKSFSLMGSFEGQHIGYNNVTEYHNGNGTRVFSYHPIGEPIPETKFPNPPAKFQRNSGQIYSRTTKDAVGDPKASFSQLLVPEPHQNISKCFGLATFRSAEFTYDCPGSINPPEDAYTEWYHLNLHELYLPRTASRRVKETIEILDDVSKTTTYEYDTQSRHLFPTAAQFTNSDDKVHRTENTYIHDYVGCNSIKYDLQERNMIATPFQVKKLVDGVHVGGTEVRYEFFNDAGQNQPCIQTDNFPRPYQYYAYEKDLNTGAGTWELKGTVNEYDDSGNPHLFNISGWGDETYTWQNGLMRTRNFGGIGGFNWMYDYHTDTKFLSAITDIDGQQTTYEYDQLFRLSATHQREENVNTTYSYSYGAPNEVSRETSFTNNFPPTQNVDQQFDGLGRQTATIVNGVTKEEMIYDNQGRIDQQTYLPGIFKTISYEPSPLNRPIQELYPDESYTTTNYDSEGQYYKLTFYDENGNPTISHTDIIGQHIKTTDALGKVTEYQYDDKLNLVKVIPPNFNTSNEAFEYVYDARNRVVEKTIPGAGDQKFIYNDRDLLVASQDENMKDDGRWLVTT